MEHIRNQWNKKVQQIYECKDYILSTYYLTQAKKEIKEESGS